MADSNGKRNSPTREIREGALTPERDPAGPPPAATGITKPAIDPATGKPVEPAAPDR